MRTRTQGKSLVESLEHPRLVLVQDNNVVHVIPPALRFWRSIGASPLHGAKDVVAFALFEPVDTCSPTLVQSWLHRVGQAYQVR